MSTCLNRGASGGLAGDEDKKSPIRQFRKPPHTQNF